MNKIVVGLIFGAILGAVDGATAWFTPDAVTKWVEEKPQEFARAFVLIWKTYLAAKTPSPEQTFK